MLRMSSLKCKKNYQDLQRVEASTKLFPSYKSAENFAKYIKTHILNDTQFSVTRSRSLETIAKSII
jgi:hypothetical protein